MRRIRQTPSVPDADDFRALEYFQGDVEDQFTRIGTRTVNVGNITAGTVATFTITVKGALPDKQMAVQVAAPSGIDASLIWCGYVSDVDTVTVRLYNPTGGGINPDEATWGAWVKP